MVGSVRVQAVPAFRDNYLWLLVRDDRAVAVDPGDAAPITQALQAAGARLEAVLATHHHADHVGGIAALVAAVPGGTIPVYGSADESIPLRNHPVGDGDRFDCLELSVDVLHVPGHTHGHLAYYVAELGAVFCGDTLFAGGCGRLFEGTPAQMSNSLARLAALPAATLVYCAHEYTLSNLRFAIAVEPDNPALRARVARCEQLRRDGVPTVPSTIAEELATNPFMRCDQPAVRHAAATHAPGSDGDAIATFAALRAWKNSF